MKNLSIPREIVDELNDYFREILKEQVSSPKWWRRISFFTIPMIENNILALVYAGAAFLVLVLGFRGLNLISSGLIIAALILECSLILILAIVMFFKPEDVHNLFNEYRKLKENNDGNNKNLSSKIKKLCEVTINHTTNEIYNIFHKPEKKDKNKLFEEINKKTVREIQNLIYEAFRSIGSNENGPKTIEQLINEIPNEFLTKDKTLIDNATEKVEEEIELFIKHIRKLLYEETYEQVTNEALNLNKKLNDSGGMTASQKINREVEIRTEIKNLFTKLFPSR